MGAVVKLFDWMPKRQCFAFQEFLQGEEGQFYADKLTEFEQLLATMPVTYEQDGKGEDAIAYLHYFTHGGSDFYVTEKDKTGNGRKQAFGWACLNDDEENADYGYIAIDELLRLGVELDLYFTPAPMREVRGARTAR